MNGSASVKFLYNSSVF